VGVVHVENVFRSMNELITLLATRVHAFDPETETIPFVCECACATCFDCVDLTLADFDELCATSEHVLAPGHSAYA
jgi:hypothetical protein